MNHRFAWLRRWILMGLILAGALPSPLLAARRGRRFQRNTPPAAVNTIAPRKSMQLTYPATRRGEQTDDYHGTQVADPYRWLEDLDSPETRAWVEGQNQVTFGWLSQIASRERIRQRLTQLWNYERYGLPHKRGGRYFYTQERRPAEPERPSTCSTSSTAQPRLLIDPNTLSGDGTVAMSNWFVSDDGQYMAYGLAGAGSDWQEWHVLDVATGQKLPDHLKWIKFSRVAWLPDGSGFYYSRYDEPPAGEKYTGANYFQKLYFHKLGDAAGEGHARL